MTEIQNKKTGQNDLKDVIIAFSVIILVLVIFSLLDLFKYMRDIVISDEFRIVEFLFVLMLFGFAFAFFSRRRWTEAREDIIIKEKDNEELQDNINRLRTTVDLSPDAIVVHREGKIVFANKAAVTLFRAKSEEDLFEADAMTLVHSSFKRKVEIRMEEMLKYMRQLPPIDILIRRLDDTYIDVSSASTPILYHAIPHVVTILRDITERKKAEELRAQLASIVVSTSDAIYTMDTEGIIQSWNPAAEVMYGYKETEAFGNSVSLIIPIEKKSELGYLLNKLNRKETIMSFETKRVRKDGSVIDVSLSIAPIFEGSDIVTGGSVIARDITFKKRAEEELRRYAEELALSNEELYVFSYAASHDLQEPLRTIQTFIQLLNEKYKKKLSKEVDEYLESADDGVTRMHRLISDFLMYSRVGSESVVYEPVDMNIVLKDAKANLKIAIKESNAEIKHFTLPTVKGNLQHLTQVLQNLISNAIKYQSENKPYIEIMAQKRETDWLFSVKDNGIGIEQWFSERIFIVFQKLHDHKKYPGSGIGLALCKRVVEKHKGKIWFESSAGKGATFFFTLPILETEEKVKTKKTSN